MDPNPGLNDAANATFVITIMLYALSMFGYAVEYAFDRRARKVVTAERVLVGAGGGETTVGDTDGSIISGPVGPQISPKHARTAGRLAFIGMALGVVTHAATMVLRAFAAGYWPWGNMFEFVLGVTLVGVVAWTVMVVRQDVPRRLSVFPMLVTTLLMAAATQLYVEAAPLVPALNSYWIAIHVFAAILAAGLFMVGFVAAAMHLIKRRHDAVVSDGGTLRFPITLGKRLTDANALERLTFRLHVLAFPIWTFGVLAGAVWARDAWGRYWDWDPKEIWSFIAWVVYAAYLHARVSGPAARRWAPWIAVIGWAVMLFNLFGVNLLLSGLHSYSGV